MEFYSHSDGNEESIKGIKEGIKTVLFRNNIPIFGVANVYRGVKITRDLNNIIIKFVVHDKKELEEFLKKSIAALRANGFMNAELENDIITVPFR